MRRAGVVVGFLFLAAIPLINGNIINVRSFALVFLLLAILDKDPVERGVLTAIGVLFSQLVVFVLPMLLYDGLRSSDAPRNWTTRFVMSGPGTGILCFASLLPLWGPTAVVRGIDMTFLPITEYAVAHQDNYNPFSHPLLWLKNLVRVATTLLFVLVPAGFTMLEATLTDREHRWDPFGLAVLLSGTFLLTLLIKSLPYYWMFPTAFLAVVSAIGAVRWADQSTSKTVLETDLPSNHE